MPIGCDEREVVAFLFEAKRFDPCAELMRRQILLEVVRTGLPKRMHGRVGLIGAAVDRKTGPDILPGMTRVIHKAPGLLGAYASYARAESRLGVCLLGFRVCLTKRLKLQDNAKFRGKGAWNLARFRSTVSTSKEIHHETHLPTLSGPPQKDARISRQNENGRRTRCH